MPTLGVDGADVDIAEGAEIGETAAAGVLLVPENTATVARPIANAWIAFNCDSYVSFFIRYLRICRQWSQVKGFVTYLSPFDWY
jgi:hypothetical protein